MQLPSHTPMKPAPGAWINQIGLTSSAYAPPENSALWLHRLLQGQQNQMPIK